MTPLVQFLIDHGWHIFGVLFGAIILFIIIELYMMWKEKKT
jgi:hypothetical protein